MGEKEYRLSKTDIQTKVLTDYVKRDEGEGKGYHLEFKEKLNTLLNEGIALSNCLNNLFSTIITL